MTIYNKRINYRKIYEQHYGPIPKDECGRTYDIHHIDGNHDNNDPANLQAVSLVEHYDIHYSQGDWAACLIMSVRMKISPEEISRIASLHAKERTKKGTHSLQNPEVKKRALVNSIERQRPLFENGMHPLQSLESQKKARETIQSKIDNGTFELLDPKVQELRIQATKESNKKRLTDKTHNFFDPACKEKARLSVIENCHKRVQNGTHPFLGGEIQRKSAIDRLHNGTHPSQKSWTCQHCNKSGRGNGNYIRYHGDNCKSLKCDK